MKNNKQGLYGSCFLRYTIYVGPHDGCERSFIMSTASISSIYGCMFRLFGEFCDNDHACTVFSGMPYRAANSACVSPDIARTVTKLQSCSSVQVSTSSPGSTSGKRLRNSVRLGTRSSSLRHIWNCATVIFSCHFLRPPDLPGGLCIFPKFLRLFLYPKHRPVFHLFLFLL